MLLSSPPMVYLVRSRLAVCFRHSRVIVTAITAFAVLLPSMQSAAAPLADATYSSSASEIDTRLSPRPTAVLSSTPGTISQKGASATMTAAPAASLTVSVGGGTAIGSTATASIRYSFAVDGPVSNTLVPIVATFTVRASTGQLGFSSTASGAGASLAMIDDQGRTLISRAVLAGNGRGILESEFSGTMSGAAMSGHGGTVLMDGNAGTNFGDFARAFVGNLVFEIDPVFVSRNPGYSLAVTGGSVPPVVPPAVVPASSSRLVNLSVLTNIAVAGDNFTMGYVVGGAGTNGTKPVLIRAAGPTLGAAPFSLPGTLSDPKLEVFAGTTKTSENDNWGGTAALTTAFSSVGAFGYTGGASLDSAIVSTVSPGDNSVRVSANGSGTGTVIAELYDSVPSSNITATTPRLVNVSVLKNLGTGLTVGFVIDGTGAKKVLIRAVGPTLGTAPFNIIGVVADPQLTLFAQQNAVSSNDNWGGTAELTAAFAQVGAFPLPSTSRDAALLATLQPGNYTVQVRGVGPTGIAIVEVYEVP